MLKNLILNTDPKVHEVFDNYPDEVKEKMLHLRQMIIETADEIEEISELEETLKWGEPSYIAKKGSTLRMDWKEKSPDQYAMYFSCTSMLVHTFRDVYGHLFKFEGNRALVFDVKDEIPKRELKECIKAALMYHRVKDLPMLGIENP